MLHSRRLAAIASGLAAALTLAACSGSPAPTSPDGSGSAAPSTTTDAPVTLHFVWWGNDTRNKLTNDVIAKFEAKYPNITVEGEATDWAGYWQKLSTQIAGGSAPDIIQMDERYIADYASQGALADLESLSLNTADFAPGTVDAGRFDGTLYAATIAINAMTFLANPSVFEKAGVAMPDDTTWTWEDMARITTEVSAKGNGEYFGMQNMIGQDGPIKTWIRQSGGEQFTPTGIGFDAAPVESWMQYWTDLQKAGGTPPASATVQDQTTAIDQSLFGTNKTGISYQWSNQVNALQNATGQDLVLLRPPSQTGKAADAKLWFKSSQYLSIAEASQHKDAAVLFVDYFLNDAEAGAILGTERGVPVNLKVRAAVQDTFDAANKKAVAYLDAISAELGTPSVVPPPGSGVSEEILRRHTDGVLLGDADIPAAATAFLTELKQELNLG